MTIVGRLSNDGQLSITGKINERLPVITDGLISHFPFDGTVFDGVGGYLPTTMSEPNRNLIEANNLDWKDPNNWTRYTGTGTIYWDNNENALVMDGYYWGIFNGFISIDTSKHWYIEAEMKKIGGGRMYLGDVSYKKDKVTTTPQHPGTHEFFGAVDYVVPTTWTRYNNNVIGGAARTGTSTVLSAYGAFEPECAFVRPLILANYSTGVVGTDKTYIKNFNWYCTDVDTSNCTLDNNGVTVEVGTTNLWSGAFAIYNNYGMPSTNVVLPETFLGQQINRVSIQPNAASLNDFKTNLGSHGVYGSPRTYLANIKYAISVYWRPITYSDNTQVGLCASNIGGWTDIWTIPVGDGWYRSVAHRDGTVTTDKYDNIFLSFKCPNAIVDKPIYIDWTCPQIEEGNMFATSYVNGNRPIDGKCFIPLSFTQNTTFAVCVNVTGGRTDDLACDIICDDSDRWNGQVRINDRTIELLIRTNARASTGNIYSILSGPAVRQVDGKSHCYVIQSIAGYGTKIYQDSNLVVDSPNYYVEYTSVSIGRNGMGNLTTRGGTYRNVSFYNKVLSQEEINKLSGNKLSITKDGNINSLKIIECPNSIPSDAYYIPLGFDARDKNKLITPTTESNLTYKDGAVWIGDSVTNLYKQATHGTDFSVNGNGIFTVRNLGNEIEFQYNYTQNLSWTYHGQTMAVVIGTVYKASMDVFISSDANMASTGTTFVANMEGGCSTGFSYDNTKKGTWQHFENTVTATGISTNLYMYPCTDPTPSTTGFVKYKNIMVTSKTFVPAWANGTRPYSRLNYGGLTPLMNNWDNFTFIMWATYKSNTNYKLSGTWGKFYFGLSSTNVLMFSWIETGTQRSVSASSVTPMDKKVMIACSVSNGVFIDLYYNGNRECNFTSAFSLNNAASDFAFNSLTAGDSSYPLNAYVQDAIFIPRAITPTEMSNIYKTTMKNSDFTLQVNGKITENSIII